MDVPHSHNEQSPLVSVVVPNYNHARFLPQRLESIAAQTFRDFELIVLDDASTDDSLDVIRRYSSHIPMRLVANEQNTGSSFVQWRRGAELARGQYLWIAESDDYAHPEFLEELVPLLERLPNVGLAYAESQVVDSEGALRGTYLDYYLGASVPRGEVERWRADFVADGRAECANYLAFLNTIPNASAVVSRRELFLRASSAQAPLGLMGDWAIWISMLLQSDLAFVARPLNYFREHASSVRKKTRWGAAFREHCMISASLAKEFENDPEVRKRISRHVAQICRDKYRELSPADDWRWFVGVARLQWAIGARNFLFFAVAYGWIRAVRSSLGQIIRDMIKGRIGRSAARGASPDTANTGEL